MRHVQVDLHAARAVGINSVGSGLLSVRREIGLACRSKTVAPVITLRQPAAAVKDLDTGRNRWWTIRKAGRRLGGNAESVFALERRVRAPEIVCSGDTV